MSTSNANVFEIADRFEAFNQSRLPMVKADDPTSILFDP